MNLVRAEAPSILPARADNTSNRQLTLAPSPLRSLQYDIVIEKLKLCDEAHLLDEHKAHAMRVHVGQLQEANSSCRRDLQLAEAQLVLRERLLQDAQAAMKQHDDAKASQASECSRAIAEALAARQRATSMQGEAEGLRVRVAAAEVAAARVPTLEETLSKLQGEAEGLRVRVAAAEVAAARAPTLEETLSKLQAEAEGLRVRVAAAEVAAARVPTLDSALTEVEGEVQGLKVRLAVAEAAAARVPSLEALLAEAQAAKEAAVVAAHAAEARAGVHEAHWREMGSALEAHREREELMVELRLLQAQHRRLEEAQLKGEWVWVILSCAPGGAEGGRGGQLTFAST
jgi:hypothetical protein